MTDLYRTQRTMRAMRRIAFEKGTVALLDVGTSKVACLILQLQPRRFSEHENTAKYMQAMARFRVIGASMVPSRGIAWGEIIDIPKAERTIRSAVQAAQKMANTHADHAIVCFGGARPCSHSGYGEIDLNDAAVSEADIALLLAKAKTPEFPPERDILHAQPVNFMVDHRSGIIDPRGQLGRTLMADLHVLSVERYAVTNLLHCLKNCGLEPAGLASSSYVSGLSTLLEDEQELGAACIDLGGETTGISVFFRRHMIHADTVPMGGRHVTSDISKGLKISVEMAERIKNFYGGLVATGMDDREMVDISCSTGDWEHDNRRISRSEIIGIIRPRMEEILEEVRKKLDAAGFEYLPSQQIVLTGGSSQIPGLDAIASNILGPQVRLGKPFLIQGLPQALIGPAFSGLVGLSLFATSPQDECWDFALPRIPFGKRTLQNAVRWLNEHW